MPSKKRMTYNPADKDHASLLMYFETCVVDHGGLVDGRRMNADDFATAKLWCESGFTEFRRLKMSAVRHYATCGHFNHRVILSDAAMAEAHNQRRLRAKRGELRVNEQLGELE